MTSKDFRLEAIGNRLFCLKLQFYLQFYCKKILKGFKGINGSGYEVKKKLEWVFQ